jgi:two-component system, cell cycle sensor histidine kinase and response regulator CckA
MISARITRHVGGPATSLRAHLFFPRALLRVVLGLLFATTPGAWAEHPRLESAPAMPLAKAGVWHDPYFVFVSTLVAALALMLFWQRRLVLQLAQQAKRLRDSEERLTLVLDGSADGFWDWDMCSGRIERSDRWAAMLGYTVPEIAKNLDGGRSLVHPDDLQAYDFLQEQLNRGESDRYDIEYRMRAKDGAWRWIHDRGKVVARTANGTPLRMAGTHTDITGRKNAEAALFASEALAKRSAHLLEQTQAAARVGGWQLELPGGRMYWTREMFRIHGTSPETFQPTKENALQFFPPESRSAMAAALESASRTGSSYALEVDLVTAQQRRIRIHATGAAEIEGGRVVKIYGSFRDVTDERNAEQEREKLRLKMLETQKLESLGVLAGGIAHDFNNLLTVVLANVAFARETPAANPDRLGNIENAARRAADLCRQMLAYAGKATFLVQRIDVSDLVRDTAQLLQVSLGRDAELDLALAAGLPVVEGDVSQLRQVVMNLVLNASEALGNDPGRIRVVTQAGRFPVAGRGVLHSFDLPEGATVCLEISDTGHGMNATTLARIFDPFFTTKFTGRGLGLAAVLGIVRTHRGALQVESEPGRGSTFRLFLPATGAAKTIAKTGPTLARASA